MRLLAATSVANDQIASTNRASPQDDFGAACRPIGFELVWRDGKWDKQNRTSLGLCPSGVDLDAHHDWIGIRRGRCRGCGKTFTFLPLLSLPYTHYSLLTRGQALRRRLVEHCSWEEATPTLKDPNRVPDASTLRRWAQHLDPSQPALSFLRQTLARVKHWLAPGNPGDHQAGSLSWLTPILQVLWPLRR